MGRKYVSPENKEKISKKEQILRLLARGYGGKEITSTLCLATSPKNLIVDIRNDVMTRAIGPHAMENLVIDLAMGLDETYRCAWKEYETAPSAQTREKLLTLIEKLLIDRAKIMQSLGILPERLGLPSEKTAAQMIQEILVDNKEGKLMMVETVAPVVGVEASENAKKIEDKPAEHGDSCKENPKQPEEGKPEGEEDKS